MGVAHAHKGERIYLLFDTFVVVELKYRIKDRGARTGRRRVSSFRGTRLGCPCVYGKRIIQPRDDRIIIVTNRL